MRDIQPTSIGAERCRFGVFEFDGTTLELTRAGRIVPVRPQPLKLLTLLLATPGELVSRDDIQRALWSDDTFVDFEQGVNHAIRELRAALGDEAESPRFIQTLPRRGYRFVAPVERVILPDAPRPSESRRWQRTGTQTIAAAVVTACAAIGYFALRQGVASSPYSPAALTVRPFAAPDDAAIGVGLANAITARLGGQQDFSVRSERPGSQSRPSLMLDGEIGITGTHVDVVARLRDVNGRAIWSERIQVRSDELFSLEDVIAERVVTALRVRLAAGEQVRLRKRYTGNSAAYSEYLRGRAAMVRYTPEGTLTAIEAFEGALRTDPGYALARAGLAMASADMYLRFAPAGEVERWGERAEAEARAALDLDADLAEAHLARAAVARKREFDWNATVSAGRRALVLNPNLDQARFFIAGAYYHNGYMQEALIETEKGRSLLGVDLVEPIRIEALTALFSGNFAPAQARLEEVSRMSSQAIGDTYLALAYYYTGNISRGRAMLEELAKSRSASTAARSSAALAGILAAQGDRSGAVSLVDRVLTDNYRDHHVAYSLGAAYAQLGDYAQADRWLRTAADSGFPCLPFFERDPLLDPLRQRPEFAVLLTFVRARRESALSPI